MASCGPHALPAPSPWFLLYLVVQTRPIARLWDCCWHLLPFSEVRLPEALVREGLANAPGLADPVSCF